MKVYKIYTKKGKLIETVKGDSLQSSPEKYEIKSGSQVVAIIPTFCFITIHDVSENKNSSTIID